MAVLAVVGWIVRSIGVSPQHESVELLRIGRIHPALEVEDVWRLRDSAADHPILKLRLICRAEGRVRTRKCTGRCHQHERIGISRRGARGSIIAARDDGQIAFDAIAAARRRSRMATGTLLGQQLRHVLIRRPARIANLGGARVRATGKHAGAIAPTQVPTAECRCMFIPAFKNWAACAARSEPLATPERKRAASGTRHISCTGRQRR